MSMGYLLQRVGLALGPGPPLQRSTASGEKPESVRVSFGRPYSFVRCDNLLPMPASCVAIPGVFCVGERRQKSILEVSALRGGALLPGTQKTKTQQHQNHIDIILGLLKKQI